MPLDESVFRNFHMCHGEPAINNIDDVFTTKIFAELRNFQDSNTKFEDKEGSDNTHRKELIYNPRSTVENEPNYSSRISDNFLEISDISLSPKSSNLSLCKSIQLPKEINKHTISYIYRNPRKSNCNSSTNKESSKIHYNALNANNETSSRRYGDRLEEPYRDAKEDFSHNKTRIKIFNNNLKTKISSCDPNKNLFSSSSVLNGYYLRDPSYCEIETNKFKEMVINAAYMKNRQPTNCYNAEKSSKVIEKVIKFSDQLLSNMMDFLKSTSGMNQIKHVGTNDEPPSKSEEPNLIKPLSENSSKLLKSRIQQAKNNMPGTSTVQNKSNNLKYRRTLKISSNNLEYKFSEGSSNFDCHCKQLGTEHDTQNSSNSSLKRRCMNREEFQCKLDLLLFETNVEFTNLLLNIENYVNNITKQFSELKYAINSLKDHHLRYQRKFASNIEKPLADNSEDYKDLQRKLSGINSSPCNEQNKLNMTKACLGSGIALSVIFIMFEIIIRDFFM